MHDYKMKILIVDDFATMRRIVKNLFKQLGFENVEEAEDGTQAFQKLKREGFQFVVSDWNMPNMDGFELLRKVRNDAELKELPFLLITAESEKQKVVDAIKAGVSSYIVKPFAAEVLKDKMDKIFGKIGK